MARWERIQRTASLALLPTNKSLVNPSYLSLKINQTPLVNDLNLVLFFFVNCVNLRVAILAELAAKTAWLVIPMYPLQATVRVVINKAGPATPAKLCHGNRSGSSRLMVCA